MPSSTARQSQVATKDRKIGSETHRYQRTPKPDRPSSPAHASECEACAATDSCQASSQPTARPVATAHGCTRSRSLLRPSTTSRSRPGSACNTPLTPHSRPSRITDPLNTASANTMNGTARRSRAVTPKCARNDSPSGACIRPVRNAHAATGPHARSAQKIARRTVPKPSADASPTLRCRRISTSSRCIQPVCPACVIRFMLILPAAAPLTRADCRPDEGRAGPAAENQ